jgi:Zn-dependent protease
VLLLLRHPSALLGVALALLVGIVAHSVVQAAVARALGDRQPAARGRLNPDPRRHFDPFGVIVMLLAGVGWNKPVPFTEPRFRGGRTRYVLAVLSGPATNLLLAVVGLIALRAVQPPVLESVNPGASSVVSFGFGQLLLLEFALVNAAVGVLTLIPLPPLDGARILWAYVPQTGGWRNARYQLEERNIGIGICVLLLLPIFGGVGLLMSVVLAVTGAFLAPIAQALGLLIGF